MKEEESEMKKYAKLLGLILAFAMAFSLMAAGSAFAADDAKPELPEFETVTEGKLTVATSPDFAPYEFYAIVDGEPVLAGFDVALAGYIADYLGLELEIIPMDFDGVLNELASGGVDLGMAGLSPDPKRMDAMDFSEVYYQGGQSFVTTQANKDLFKSLEDTNKAEYSIGAQNGSIQMDLANTNSPEADIVALVKVTDIVAELLGGKLDGAYIETAVAENYASNYPDLAVVLEVPYESEGSAVGVVKGNAGLLEAVNMAVAAALEDGSMDSFVAEANEQSVGAKYEGLLDAEDAEAAIAEAVAEAEAA
jgi:polar amino acid transport system substrate-binding protein